MKPLSIADAVAAVSAYRYGCPDVLAQLIDEGCRPGAAEDLVEQVGAVTTAVHGVVMALAGHGDVSLGLRSLPEAGGIGELAVLAVRCAAEGDRDGLEVVCAEALEGAQLPELLRRMIADVNEALDALELMPGPGPADVLCRLGLAAAFLAA